MSAQRQRPLQAEPSDFEMHSECSQISQAKASRPEGVPVEAEFQKNYPKNIFIPLIEYLTELGYQQACEKCVGKRCDFQGKNVVSLTSIFTLITQDWFRRNINREAALAHLSNKVLINSKIKKKLFHLLIAHLILMPEHWDLKEFKRRISKQANLIARKQLPHDQVFAYPNAIIYLLHLFRRILMLHANKKNYSKMELQQEFAKLTLEEEGKNLGSKEEYKFYVKEIVHIFSGKSNCLLNGNDLLEETKQTIIEKDKQLREKYQLVEGIPNWTPFLECVVMRCFEHKRRDAKITNHIFNEWINDCKNKMLSIEHKQMESNLEKNTWEADSVRWLHNQLDLNNQNWNALPTLSLSEDQPIMPVKTSNESAHPTANPKQFTPIILSTTALK